MAEMSITEVLILLVVAAICGFLAQMIAGYSRGGLIVAMVLGFIGAMLGTWIARNMQLPELFALQINGVTFPIVWSIIGATLFVAVIGMLTQRSRAY